MTCSIPGCNRPVKARGWCEKHWSRWYKKGSPAAGRDYSHAKRYFAEVVLPYQGDGCLIWPFATTAGYGRLDDKLVNRLVCEAEHGPPPFPKAEAAHSCDVRACVARKHLHWATRKENEDDKLRVWAVRGRYSRKLDELQD